jgi:hypothetical protein
MLPAPLASVVILLMAVRAEVLEQRTQLLVQEQAVLHSLVVPVGLVLLMRAPQQQACSQVAAVVVLRPVRPGRAAMAKSL